MTNSQGGSTRPQETGQNLLGETPTHNHLQLMKGPARTP
jgi:hypothetical protein